MLLLCSRASFNDFSLQAAQQVRCQCVKYHWINTLAFVPLSICKKRLHQAARNRVQMFYLRSVEETRTDLHIKPTFPRWPVDPATVTEEWSRQRGLGSTKAPYFVPRHLGPPPIHGFATGNPHFAQFSGSSDAVLPLDGACGGAAWLNIAPFALVEDRRSSEECAGTDRATPRLPPFGRSCSARVRQASRQS